MAEARVVMWSISDFKWMFLLVHEVETNEGLDINYLLKFSKSDRI
jgi:hypothetical protein